MGGTRRERNPINTLRLLFKIENQRIQILTWKQGKHMGEGVDVNGV